MLQTVLFLLVVLGFNLIQMIGAFAGTMLAMPFSILLIGAERARVVLNAVSIYCCVWPILRSGAKICWPEVGKIAFWMLLGILAAQALLDVLLSPVVLLLYSLLVIGVALRNFFRQRELALPKAVDILVLLGAGLVHGAFLSGGSLLVIYAMRHLREKDVFRATLSVIWLVLNCFLLTVNVLHGGMTGENLRLFLLATPAALLGILVGDLLQKRLEGDRFRRFANCLLLLSGAVLLFNCLHG